MPNCKRATALISQSMDKKLSILQRISLRLHFIKCERCKRYKKQLSFLRMSSQKMAQHISDITE